LGETIRTIITFPPQIQRGWHYVPKQALLFTPTAVIHILASIWSEQAPQVTCIKACSLLYMKTSLLLLYGYLEMAAKGQDSPTRLGVEFNTVAWSRLSAPLRELLQATRDTPGLLLTDQPSYSSTIRQAVEQLPRKFSNGMKIYGLLPGEQLEALVFQPCSWQRRLYFFWRRLTADTLLLLTSNFIVVIQEELNVRQGWVLSYIPRRNVVGMRNQSCGMWNELSVQLQGDDQFVNYKLLLNPESVEVWHKQWIEHGGLWQELPGQRA
jgi:hypothetical protein